MNTPKKKGSWVHKGFDFDQLLWRISKILSVFVILKLFIWKLEAEQIWFSFSDLDIIFTISGFALGIILSQKITTTYGKWMDLQNEMACLQGQMTSLEMFLDGMKPCFGEKCIKAWGKSFMEIFDSEDTGNALRLKKINDTLYQSILNTLKNDTIIPHHRFAALMSGFFTSANRIMIIKSTYTPVVYNTFLRHIVVLYIFLLCVFIPGLGGVISVIFATYLLYGMYYITDDFDLCAKFDSVSLIKLDPERLHNYLLTIDMKDTKPEPKKR